MHDTLGPKAGAEDNAMKYGKWMMAGWAALLVALFTFGCETSSVDNEGTVTLAQLQGLAPTNAPVEPGTTNSPTTDDPATDDPATDDPATEPPTDGTTTNSLWPAEITGTVRFLHTDVSRWPETASLHARVGGGTISMPYSKAKVWPAVDGVNANPWVFVNLNGQWYAATFEWLRQGQTSKPKGVLDGSMGDHIKASPLSGWTPHSGERIGIMVSGLARTKMRNVEERSNVSMVTWP